MQIIVGAARGDGDGPLMKQHSESVQYLTYQCPEEAPAAAVSRPAALPVIVSPQLRHQTLNIFIIYLSF